MSIPTDHRICDHCGNATGHKWYSVGEFRPGTGAAVVPSALIIAYGWGKDACGLECAFKLASKVLAEQAGEVAA